MGLFREMATVTVPTETIHLLDESVPRVIQEKVLESMEIGSETTSFEVSLFNLPILVSAARSMAHLAERRGERGLQAVLRERLAQSLEAEKRRIDGERATSGRVAQRGHR